MIPESQLETPGSAQCERHALLFVLVDGTAADERTLAMATRVAQNTGMHIVLVGFDPGDPLLPDPEAVAAQMTLAELGLGTVLLEPHLDAEARIMAIFHKLLLLQRRLVEAGVDSTIRLVHGDRFEHEIREVIAAAPHGSALALGNPMELFGPPRDVTAALIVAPPCSLFVTGVNNPTHSLRWYAIRWILRRVWPRYAY
jgi:hypothetical protein